MMASSPSRVFMNGNSQALLEALAGFDAEFVQQLEQLRLEEQPMQEREQL